MKILSILCRYVLLSILILTLNIPKAKAQEKVVFNQTVTWEWPLPKWYGGNSFYWWHRSMEGVGVTNFGDMSSTDWQSPANYRNGTFYMRFEVLSQPTNNPFRIQFGIWQDISKAGGHTETISENVNVVGGTGSVTATSIGSPASWWQIRTDAPVDFTRPEDFYRIGVVLWKGNCVPKGQGWGTDGCPEYQAEFFPMQARITVVAVAQGSTFSGWSNYTGGTTIPPTPTYSIDFINKLTYKVVASTDEYSYSSNMSGAVTGNGQKLTLTPGQNVYFRVKAVGGTPASLVQLLVVPGKPAAPTFTYNAANLQTIQTISNEYEYADNASMTGAITGSGGYVSFALGTTKYFRKKASSSAFESNVQALLGSGSVPPSSIGPEFVILNEIIDYPNSTDDNGFYFFYYNSSMPSNWLTPYNYYTGQVYTRYEIVSQASSEPVGLQFGIWQKLPPVTGTLYENMEAVRALNGPGSMVTNNSSPSSWWKSNGGCDFTQMDKVWHFGINPYRVNPSQANISANNAAVWNVRFTYWFPMKVRVTVVAVASGYTFSGWNNYPAPTVNKPPTPTYSIDYLNELSDKVVPSTDEYSVNSNMSGAVSGTGAKITLTPGQDIYFRTKATGGNPASDIQFLDIPARPAIPTFTYDAVNQRTTQTVSNAYEYVDNASMTPAITGTDACVSFPAGTTYYFRRKATPTSFKSDLQSLLATAAPVSGNCSDYLQHYWKLEENNLGTFSDYAGSLNANVAVNSTRVQGIVDFAQYFNGLAEASLPDNGSFDWNANSSFALEFWLNKSSACPAPTVVNQNIVIGRDDAATQLHWWAGVSCLDPGKINFNLIDNNGSGINLLSKQGVIDGNWHHIAIVRDGTLGITSIYIDGARDTTISYTYTGDFASTVPVNIGWLNLNAKFHLNGSIDELALYDRTITPSEITDHYNSGNAVSYCSQTETTVKIMPMGNSITFDSYIVDSRPAGDKIAYRYPLYNLLNHANHQFDYVGSESAGFNYFPDAENAGFPGIRDDQMAQLLNTGYNPLQSVQETPGPYLDSYLPDIILLHVGTNNVQESAADVENILNEIDAFKTRTGKDTKVILARIINRQVYNQTTTTFNNNVSNMAISRNDSDIYFVDMEDGSGINYATDMTDDLHPNAIGYQKMAINWFNKLSEILPQKTYGPRIEISPANTGTANVAYNSRAYAIGNPAPSFSLLSSPNGMNIHNQTGVITWTPTNIGIFPITVIASNLYGSDTISYNLNINNGIVGYTQIFSSAGGTLNREAQPVTMTETGMISSISVYHQGGSGNVILAIYNTSNGLPGQRIAISQVTPVNSTQGWQTVDLISPVSVSQGTTVWLAWVFQNSVGLRYSAGTPGRARSSQTYAGGMPDPFGSSSVSSSIYSIYANYIASSLKSTENEFIIHQLSDIDQEQSSVQFDVYPTIVKEGFTARIVLPEIKDVSIAIYNVLGVKLRDLVNDKMEKGEHFIYVDDLPDHTDKSNTEVLFVRLVTNNSVEVRKILLSNE